MPSTPAQLQQNENNQGAAMAKSPELSATEMLWQDLKSCMSTHLCAISDKGLQKTIPSG